MGTGASGNSVLSCVISGNFAGVDIDVAGTGNLVDDNWIGTDKSGELNVGNLEDGVELIDTTGNFAESNTIDNNGGWGVLLFASAQNTLSSNSFAANALGSVDSIGFIG